MSDTLPDSASVTLQLIARLIGSPVRWPESGESSDLSAAPEILIQTTTIGAPDVSDYRVSVALLSDRGMIEASKPVDVKLYTFANGVRHWNLTRRGRTWLRVHAPQALEHDSRLLWGIKETHAYPLSDSRGARTLMIPPNDGPYLGNPLVIVRDIEAREAVRLCDGGNPQWLIRLFRSFVEKRDPANGITFGSYSQVRHPTLIEIVEPPITPAMRAAPKTEPNTLGGEFTKRKIAKALNYKDPRQLENFPGLLIPTSNRQRWKVNAIELERISPDALAYLKKHLPA